MRKQTKSTTKAKRAAIYVRVSSEGQAKNKKADKSRPDAEHADRFSPQAQEDDARAYCEQRGYSVAGLYRDAEKYRVGKRMVEPSGTRADRPGLKRMLADADEGKIDVIIAWREDRLYRGYRPMLDVLECIERNHIDIELVKETFDKRMMGGKVWVAKMELDAKSDRFRMGVRGRLESGKTWNQPTKYGYIRHDGIYAEHPKEAEWVRQVWQWYADGLGVEDIRRRLVNGCAPQRHASKVLWERAIIYAMLADERYHTGVEVFKWDGEVYEMSLPPLIDPELAQRVSERRRQRNGNHARHVKHDYLGMGLSFCAACNRRVKFTTQFSGRIKPYRSVRCPHNGDQLQDYPGCFGGIPYAEFELKLWEKVYRVLSDDELFMTLVNKKIEQLSHDEKDAAAEIERLSGQLENIAMERQRVITYARREAITADDLAIQTRELDATAAEKRRELQEKSVLVGNRAERLIDFMNDYRARLRKGIQKLQAEPVSDARRDLQRAYRKRVVEEIVERVDVLSDKSVTVHFVFDVSESVHISQASTD